MPATRPASPESCWLVTARPTTTGSRSACRASWIPRSTTPVASRPPRSPRAWPTLGWPPYGPQICRGRARRPRSSRRRSGCDVALDERLREGYRGRWEGQRFIDIERDEPELYAAWRRGGAAFRFPGGRVAARAAAARDRGGGEHPRGFAAARARGLSRRLDPRHAVPVRPPGPRCLPQLRGPQHCGGADVTRLPAVVLAMLAVATAGAFFVVQHLKSTTPLITGVSAPVPSAFNPRSGVVCQVNGQAVDFKQMQISFYLLHRSDDVDVYMIDQSGQIVATLASGRHMRKGVRRPDGVFTWDGRDDNGRFAPDGLYSVRVDLIHQGRTYVIGPATGGPPTPVKVETHPPQPVVTSVSPQHIPGLWPHARRHPLHGQRGPLRDRPHLPDRSARRSAPGGHLRDPRSGHAGGVGRDHQPPPGAPRRVPDRARRHRRRLQYRAVPPHAAPGSGLDPPRRRQRALRHRRRAPDPDHRRRDRHRPRRGARASVHVGAARPRVPPRARGRHGLGSGVRPHRPARSRGRL